MQEETEINMTFPRWKPEFAVNWWGKKKHLFFHSTHGAGTWGPNIMGVLPLGSINSENGMEYKRINVRTESRWQMHNSFGNTAAISKGICGPPGRDILNVATSQELRGYGRNTSKWAFWRYRDDSLDGYQGLGEHRGDCIKNTLRDNVMGSWSKTDRPCQTVQNSVNADWQNDWFAPWLPYNLKWNCFNESSVMFQGFSHTHTRVGAKTSHTQNLYKLWVAQLSIYSYMLASINGQKYIYIC